MESDSEKLFYQIAKHHLNLKKQVCLCDRRYRVDFLEPTLKIIFEIDGEVWHNKQRDDRRDSELEALGYKTIRIPASKLWIKTKYGFAVNHKGLEEIRETIKKLEYEPSLFQSIVKYLLS